MLLKENATEEEFLDLAERHGLPITTDGRAHGEFPHQTGGGKTIVDLSLYDGQLRAEILDIGGNDATIPFREWTFDEVRSYFAGS